MLEPLLSSLSPLWALTNTVARKMSAGHAHRLPAPVISVGNIVAGGVGKTEVAAAIAARLARQGKRVVVASRGYGSAWEGSGAVAHDAETALAHRFPDEAIVLLTKAPGASVAVGADRHAVLERHWGELQPDAVVLDDGFQHFKLARDLDVLVHDFTLRWPVLRDWPGALTRAGVRIALSEVPAQWRRDARAPWVRARYRVTGARDIAGKAHGLPREALVFCGLGNPSRFSRSLEEVGVKVKGVREFRDHHDYALDDARRLADWARKRGLPLLTSLKDYVKLGPYLESQGAAVPGFEPRWVAIELEFLENENLLWEAVERALVAGARFKRGEA